MEVVAKSNINISPRKVNLVASAIRGKKTAAGLTSLLLLDKRAAGVISKVLKSAIANASHNNKMDTSDLLIKRVDVVPGLAYKRFRPSTRGRTHPYKKKTTHLTIVLEGPQKEVSNGTKS